MAESRLGEQALEEAERLSATPATLPAAVAQYDAAIGHAFSCIELVAPLRAEHADEVEPLAQTWRAAVLATHARMLEAMAPAQSPPAGDPR
jgi:hypothetical protein